MAGKKTIKYKYNALILPIDVKKEDHLLWFLLYHPGQKALKVQKGIKEEKTHCKSNVCLVPFQAVTRHH